MEVKQLQSIIAVANTKSVSVAAQRLNLTKGAVSKHISSLEDELGELLFDKNSVLTEAGKRFYTRANNILKEIAECKYEIEVMKGNICGELRIGVGSFIEPYIRRAAIEFMKRYPNVLLHAQFAHASVLNKMMHENQLDLAFTMNTAYYYEEFVSKPSIPFHLSAIMSNSNKLAAKKIVTYEDLMQERVIMPDVGERVFQTFQKYVAYDLSKLPVIAIVSDPDATCKTLGELNCVTFLPSEYADSNLGLVSRPIEGLEMKLMSNAHWKKDKPLKDSAKRFLEIIKEMTDDRNN